MEKKDVSRRQDGRVLKKDVSQSRNMKIEKLRSILDCGLMDLEEDACKTKLLSLSKLPSCPLSQLDP